MNCHDGSSSLLFNQTTPPFHPSISCLFRTFATQPIKTNIKVSENSHPVGRTPSIVLSTTLLHFLLLKGDRWHLNLLGVNILARFSMVLACRGMKIKKSRWKFSIKTAKNTCHSTLSCNPIYIPVILPTYRPMLCRWLAVHCLSAIVSAMSSDIQLLFFFFCAEEFLAYFALLSDLQWTTM